MYKSFHVKCIFKKCFNKTKQQGEMFNTRFFSLGFCILEFVLYFVLRVSCFLSHTCLVLAMPALGSNIK
ncbi:hypothetical protein KsCSTR_38190 [Candidatus Kuenenia stuttgartiensis]|uniref:Uncharacterized protein n=1 Tax=Kuenenia stuttgartiensis TaxID=174633 RepID=Q1Q608_KUEST|nr:hypothetical protein KsCSTR_38190 [Candidatus Kuenenia stuttgartiensis]TVL98803.1 MAG: hypothetical protein CV080_08885 [Candidatus Kuenenia stuttgartiensis]CAJ73004.1 unknown protein [Candidatus Kuenenia stuttgartiensis]